MFGFSRRIVLVTFVEHATTSVISSVRMPLERLPEAFTDGTELKMEGAEYVVVRATPPTKPEFTKTRRLVVLVRKRAPTGA
jgi:hypothetical protein